jgi:hypothetical protein
MLYSVDVLPELESYVDSLAFDPSSWALAPMLDGAGSPTGQ